MHILAIIMLVVLLVMYMFEDVYAEHRGRKFLRSLPNREPEPHGWREFWFRMATILFFAVFVLGVLMSGRSGR
jgi:hypothetical protein